MKGTGIHVAAVSTAFPHGLAPLSTRLAEIEASVADGADEIDVVIPRGLVFGAKWQELYDEIGAFRAACGEAHLKVILGTGDLATLRNVTLASMVAMMAGADFIKTSTGKESVNATLPVGLAMVRAIRAYHEQTGYLDRLQAGRRYLDREGRARLAGADEGGTRPAVAGARAVPLRRVEPADRHRAPARAPCQRPLFGQPPPRDGVRRLRQPSLAGRVARRRGAGPDSSFATSNRSTTFTRPCGPPSPMKCLDLGEG